MFPFISETISKENMDKIWAINKYLEILNCFFLVVVDDVVVSEKET